MNAEVNGEELVWLHLGVSRGCEFFMGLETMEVAGLSMSCLLPGGWWTLAEIDCNAWWHSILVCKSYCNKITVD